jgi:hypothetical protein
MTGRAVAVLVVGVLCCPAACDSSRPKPVTGVPGSFHALEALLITDPPAGYRRQPDSVGDTGPSDIAKAIRDDDEADAKQSLIAEGFVRGYQRMWATASGDQIVVFLYQFASAAGASGSFRRWVSLEAPSGSDTTVFAPTGLPKGQTAGLSGSGGGNTGSIILYAAGIFSVQVDVTSSGSERAARILANTVAVDQLGRL